MNQISNLGKKSSRGGKRVPPKNKQGRWNVILQKKIRGKTGGGVYKKMFLVGGGGPDHERKSACPGSGWEKFQEKQGFHPPKSMGFNLINSFVGKGEKPGKTGTGGALMKGGGGNEIGTSLSNSSPFERLKGRGGN